MDTKSTSSRSVRAGTRRADRDRAQGVEDAGAVKYAERLPPPDTATPTSSLPKSRLRSSSSCRQGFSSSLSYLYAPQATYSKTGS